MAMERAFKKEIESLEAVFAFVDEFRRQELIPDEPLYAVKLALEELFTNMVKYHPESRREVVVRLERVADELVGTLTDSEVEPFDVTLVPAPAEPPLEKRRPGGLGLHLVRQMVDDLRYVHTGGSSTVIFVKKLR